MSESVEKQEELNNNDKKAEKAKAKQDKKAEKAKAKKDKKDNKSKKGLFTYLKETKAELKRVSWASKSKTVKDSVTVIFAIVLAVIFSLVIDSGISFFLKVLIK